VIIATISPVLPWATIEFKSMQLPTGFPSFGLQNVVPPTLNIPVSSFETIIYPTFSSFFIVVLAVALFTYDERRCAARGLFIMAGGFIMLMTCLYAVSTAIVAKDVIHEYYLLFASLSGIGASQDFWPNFSVGIGAYVAMLGSFMTIVAGILALGEPSYGARNVDVPPLQAVD